ncbi:MAG: hypothetical protein IJ088_09555 [Clostridia bacterium]|nr:hypothetical protein [Clostridia bacterium]
MYANQVNIAVSQKEGFIRFQHVVPNFNDRNEIDGMKAQDTVEITMSLEVFKELYGLIGNVLEGRSVQEK